MTADEQMIAEIGEYIAKRGAPVEFSTFEAERLMPIVRPDVPISESERLTCWYCVPTLSFATVKGRRTHESRMHYREVFQCKPSQVFA